MNIGVIITVYNLEKFVEDAIDSVLTQTRTPSRIIVVNDGSTDCSLEKIHRYGDKVVVVNNTSNRGVLPSIITALKMLDTTLVAFLDGDDVWRNNKLEEISVLFEKYPDAMMVTHSYEWINGIGKNVDTTDETQKNLQRVVSESKGDLIKRDILLKNSILSYKGVWLGSAFCIKKNLLDLEAFEAWSVKLWGHDLSHQDQPLAAFLIYMNPLKKIYFIDKILFQYRVFGENSSGSSATIEKALRTLSRSKATLLRTFDLVKKMPGRKEEFIRQENKLREVDYLESLYKNKRMLSLKLFFMLWKNFWTKEQRYKELQRLLGAEILGIKYFLRLKGQLKSRIRLSTK
jgi:glycosyltransferase involved in cell wall biosynthesis